MSNGPNDKQDNQGPEPEPAPEPDPFPSRDIDPDPDTFTEGWEPGDLPKDQLRRDTERKQYSASD
jgi:hypothetical protein